jgi:DNA-binding transcriptional regulator YiaG
MSNIGTVLRDEIARVARKSTKADMEALRKSSAEHRRQIAALKRQVASLARQLKSASRVTARLKESAQEEEVDGPRLRFSAKGLAKKRQQLGLSAADMAKLLGVSALSVYKWESGKTRPRTKQVEAIASIRALGKREAAARLESLS